MKASAGSAATTRASAPPAGSSTSRKAAAPEKGAAPVAAPPKAVAKPAPKAETKQGSAATEAPPAVKKPVPISKPDTKLEAKPVAETKPATVTTPGRRGEGARAGAAAWSRKAGLLRSRRRSCTTGGQPLRPAGSQSPMMNDRRPPDRMPAPRAHAKQENFVEGDHVVYPTHGVGKVERIATEEIAGQKLELIQITFEENRMTLRVPVKKAAAAGLRKLASRKMFDEALAVLKGRARIKRTMWSRRAQEYEAKINSGDPLAIAEVVRDLHRNAGQPDQSFSERQIYEAAMDRLAAELAALDKTDKATASEKLTNFLKTIV